MRAQRGLFGVEDEGHPFFGNLDWCGKFLNEQIVMQIFYHSL